MANILIKLKIVLRRVFALIILIGSTYACYSQSNDAELWENISLEKQLSRNYKFHFNHEGRIGNNISQFHYAYGDFGLTRELTKHFKATVDYVLVWKLVTVNNRYERQSWRHQWYFAGMYKDKLFKRFELEIREMYQQQFQDVYSSDAGRYADEYLRSKISIMYLFHKYPFYRFKPYIASESYYHMSNNDKYGPEFDRIRYFEGVFYNFNKKSALELYYLFEFNFNTNDPPTNYVMGIGYSKEF